MISRRLIRVKVFKVLFSRVSSGSDSINGAEKELIMSCEKTLDLYYFLLGLPAALKKISETKIEAGLKKFHPTSEELNPNRRFVDNPVIEKLENCEELRKFCENRGLLWNDYESVAKKIYSSMIKSDYYREYMSAPETSYDKDLKLILDIYEQELEDCEDLYTMLEDASLYWVDDIAYVINIIIKRLALMKEKSKVSFPKVFIKDEDREYAVRLLAKALLNYDEYVEMMARYVLNWEPERLAATDTNLIVLGIAEAIAFPNIPLKVTINEYVELSKFYSTQNSKVFVNGILDKVLIGLQREGVVQKSGRGLVGSID